MGTVASDCPEGDAGGRFRPAGAEPGTAEAASGVEPDKI